MPSSHVEVLPQQCVVSLFAHPCSEALVEDQSFPERELAAHVASRIYFHLEAFSDALKFALESGPWLDLTTNSLYAETILGRRHEAERSRMFLCFCIASVRSLRLSASKRNLLRLCAYS